MPLNLDKIDELRNRVILINQQSKELLDYVTIMNELQFMTPESKTAATNFNNIAIDLTRISEQEQFNLQAFENIFSQVENQFANIENKYLPRNWAEQHNFEPVKKIEESIVAVKKLLGE